MMQHDALTLPLPIPSGNETSLDLFEARPCPERETGARFQQEGQEFEPHKRRILRLNFSKPNDNEFSKYAKNCPQATVSEWVLAAARLRLKYARRADPPAYLYENLSVRFPGADREIVDKCFTILEPNYSKPTSRSPAWLGLLLLAARNFEHDRQFKRLGRDGRKSEPNVYTPPDVASRMLASLQIGPKKLLDPACGAGAFLLPAFGRAFERRVNAGQEPRESAIAVLTHEICGVDIDAQALAIAEFNLRLAAFNLSGLNELIPIDLRCRDALSPLAGLEGSLDLVVGNPPFVEARGLSAQHLAWLRTCFRSAATGKVNLFSVFIERAIGLLKPGGIMSFIVPSTFQRNERYQALRELLLEYRVESIEPLDRKTFKDFKVECVILRVRKEPPSHNSEVLLPNGPIPQRELAMGSDLRFCTTLTGTLRRRIETMQSKGTPLGELAEIRDGISTGFQPFPSLLLGRKRLDEQGEWFVPERGERQCFDPARHRKIIDGGEFNAFLPICWDGRYIDYDKKHEHEPPHPGRPFNCQLRSPELYDRSAKLITRQTAKYLIATVDRERYFVRNSVHVTSFKDETQYSLEALCACLNSDYYRDYYIGVTGEGGQVYPQVHISDLRKLPVAAGLLIRGGTLDLLGTELLLLHRDKVLDRVAIEQRRQRIEAILLECFEA